MGRYYCEGVGRLRFYLQTINLLAHFIWWGEWQLVRDEWNLTYKEYTDAESRSDEIVREAAERLLAGIEKGRNNDVT